MEEWEVLNCLLLDEATLPEHAQRGDMGLRQESDIN